MGLLQRIAELERELAEGQSHLELHMARMRACARELEELKGLTQSGGPLEQIALTDAIVQILRKGRQLSPKQIQAQLASAGRDEQPNKVTATLTYLVRQQRVSRVGRGSYTAV